MMSRTGLRWHRRAWARIDVHSTRPAILVGGWLLFLIYAFPGAMSPDSLLQLDQARTGNFGDWHPPLMAYLWRLCEYLLAGPFPMLVLQSVTFLLGLDAILRRFMSQRKAALLAISILLFPPVLAPMAFIWKDSQMAGYIMAGIAALLSPSRKWRLVGCGFLVLATGVRINGPAATLPVMMILFVWNDRWTRWRRYLVAGVAWVVITLAAMLANAWITDYRDYPWHNSVALLDIAGVVRFAHVKDDAQLRELLDGAPLVVQDDILRKFRRVYSPTAHYWLTHGDDRVFDLPDLPHLEGVKACWWRAVTTYPSAYLWHRSRVFREVLGLGTLPVLGAVYDQTENLSRLQAVWNHGLFAISAGVWFRPHLYFVLGFVMLWFGRRSRLVLALLTSGLVCELSLFIGAPSSDYRYSHWMIVCTIAALVAITAERARDGLQRRDLRQPSPSDPVRRDDQDRS
ncbi:MAG: hypothetical protein JWO36_974 [Myxococcales bacterium]|nr:hypothetical protein [Myxococcales bacterium]